MTELPPQRRQDLERLLAKLPLSAPPDLRWDLLDEALTHSSADSQRNYERLEFIGDSALRLWAVRVLAETYPQASVGDLSALRARLVSDETLAAIARRFSLQRHLRVAPFAAADRSGETTRLAEAFEALLGALYLSRPDFSLIAPWLTPELRREAAAIFADPARQNYKAALQEWTQGHWKLLPDYHTEEVNPEFDHPQRFRAEVYVRGEKLGEAYGKSMKLAQQSAARQAYEQLRPPS